MQILQVAEAIRQRATQGISVEVDLLREEVDLHALEPGQRAAEEVVGGGEGGDARWHDAMCNGSRDDVPGEGDRLQPAKVGLEASREVQMFYPIVVRILTAFETAPAPFFRSNLVWLWPLLAKLVRVDYSTDELDAREVLSRLMETCVGPVLAAGVEKLQ